MIPTERKSFPTKKKMSVVSCGTIQFCYVGYSFLTPLRIEVLNQAWWHIPLISALGGRGRDPLVPEGVLGMTGLQS